MSRPGILAIASLPALILACHCHAQPALLDPNLQVTPVVTGLAQPMGVGFLSANDFLTIEKASGQVKRVTNGVSTGTVLDLAVNSASERGLLSIALAPDFATNPHVYLTWTESTTGADTNVVANTSLLGNRVDRFLWNGSTLAFDRNILRYRADQPGTAPAGQTITETPRGNHNGGVIRFGADGSLYVALGDVGRRGWMQNLPNGPFTAAPFVDDSFGGPEPDNAHLTGVVLRLNPDGTTPTDNPFYAAGGAMGGEAGANVQKVFAYGIRNSFGMDVDAATGKLWMTENGDDAFDEVNLVEPGTNSGFVQFMGPAARIAQYKQIEANEFGGSLQQQRWDPDRIADTEAEAIGRLFSLPGAAYSDPEFSWKYAVAPAAMGFLNTDALGAPYEGNLFVGASNSTLDGGYLFRFVLNETRDGFSFTDPDLADLVADNAAKYGIAESEMIRFGTGFGTATQILTGPDGLLYVVSLSNGAVYQISAVPEPAALALLTLFPCLLRRPVKRAAT